MSSYFCVVRDEAGTCDSCVFSHRAFCGSVRGKGDAAAVRRWSGSLACPCVTWFVCPASTTLLLWCLVCSCSKGGQKSTLQPFLSLTNPPLVKTFIILSAAVDQSSISSSCWVYLYAFNSSCFSPERSECV